MLGIIQLNAIFPLFKHLKYCDAFLTLQYGCTYQLVNLILRPC